MAPVRKRKKIESTVIENLPELPNASSSKRALKIQRSALAVNWNAPFNLREEIRKMQQDLENIRQSGRDPLYLFPQEIWLMIFGNLDDINDQANCSRTCTLFSSIIPGTPQELLFGKVLPFLFPYFGFHPATVVTCGQVCRKWRAAVDRFAETCFRVNQPIPDSLVALKKEPEIFYCPKRLLRIRFYQIVPELEGPGHTQRIHAPFLVAMRMCLDSQQPRGPPRNLSTLDCLGHLLWSLNLKMSNRESHSTKQLYTWCAKAITVCKNLRSFRLFVENSSGGNIRDIGTDCVAELKSQSLENLAITVNSPSILGVQNKLLEELCDQLKCVEVSRWDSEVNFTNPWRNLTVLEILENGGSEVLASLQRLPAPKLHSLKIVLDATCDLLQLFLVICHFGALKQLAVLLTRAFNADVLSVPLDLLTTNQISSQEITSGDLNQGRDLPILFPLVKNLSWRYGAWWLETPSKAFDDAKPNKKVKKFGYQFIQIFKNMYESNLWTVLPRLETLELKYASRFNVKDQGRIVQRHVIRENQKFTREIYVWETEKYEMGVQKVVKNVQALVSAEQKESANKELEKLKEIAITNQNKVRLRKPSVDKIAKSGKELNKAFKQIIPFILPYLTDNDVKDCRLVCKKWSKLLGDQYQMPEAAIEISVPMTDKSYGNYMRYLDEAQTNPHVARDLEIKINRGPDKVKDVQTILPKLGKYIRNITMSSKFSGDVSDVSKIFGKCMKYCPNLQTFTLNIPVLRGISEKEFLMVNVPSLPKSFETLAFCGPDATYVNPVVCRFLDHLKKICKDKFTSLKQDQTYKLPGQYPAELAKLTKLTIRNFNTDVNCLTQKPWHWPVAPNLNELHVCVTGQQISFRDLNNIAESYPKLESLELQFTDACGGFKESLIHCDLSKIFKVTTLQIVFKSKFQICLDFLALFPYTKSLRIVYGKHASLLNNETSWQPTFSYGDLKPKYILPDRKSGKDYIQLVKYLKDENVAEHNKQEIYASNIWTVLKKLRALEIAYCGEEEIKDSRIFYRKM